MRLPYVADPPQDFTEEDEAVVQRVRARRAQGKLIPLDRALLHAPKVADGWNSYLGAIRTRTSLPDNLRELAILRPALINQAWFEWKSHLPLFQASEAYDSSKLAVVASLDPTSQGSLTDSEWVVLRYADAMTKNIRVPQDLFDELQSRAGFNEQEIVELTATVAAYNMVSRFLVALDVAEADGKVPEEVLAQRQSP